MQSNTINLRDVRKIRIERHWSQDQLAEMSGLSVRTIQRIENGENAGLESLKSLAAVFEFNIEDSNTKEEIVQIKIEEEYVRKVKRFYKLLGIAILSLLIPFIVAVDDSSNWIVVFWIIFFWALVLGIYSLITFDFFGEEWKRKIINKKFNKT